MANAYLDSGASHSVMQYAFYEKLKGATLYKDQAISHFTSASGALMECEGAVDITLYIGVRCFTEKFYVVKNLCHPLILGRSFMMKHRIRLNFADMIVQFDRKEMLYTVNPVYLAPKSDQFIHVAIGERKGCLPARITDIQGSLYSPLFPKVTQFCDIYDGTTQILLVNRTDKPIEIKPKTEIATCEPIEHEYFTDPLQIKPLLKGDLENVSELEGVTHPDEAYWEEINKLNLTDSVFNEDQREQVRQMLFRERGALAIGRELGLLNNGFRYKIELESNHEVYNCRPYRLGPIERKFMQKQLDELMTQNVVGRCLSNYASPCFLVKKPGKPGNKAEDFRFVLDLRIHNSKCKTEKYGLPHIQDNINNLEVSKFKFKSLLDLSQSFYQIGLHPDCFKYTAFKVDKLGSYCMKRMIMGHKNSSEIFQCVLEGLFDPTLKENMAIVVDDILALGEDFESHLQTLTYILRTVRVSGLKLKVEKMNLGKAELNYMGQVLTDNGVRVSDDKIESVLACKPPTSKTQLRRYMGMLNFSRHYIKNFATLARPLNQLLKGQVKGDFTLNEEQLASFEALKQALISAPVLAQINYDQPLIVTTDSSDFASGGCLSQLDSSGKERVIAYYSRSYDTHELNYPITEKEALSLISAVKKWAPYLRYNRFFSQG